MKIEFTEVHGFRRALHGMRNPMNSWDKSDSTFEVIKQSASPVFKIGPNDNELAKKLIRAGGAHRKFLRMIHIQCFITIPRYIWQELDTYKVATVRNSCSTMHKLGFTDLTEDDFEGRFIEKNTLNLLNDLGKVYRNTKAVNILRQMKQILPEGFLQGAEYDMSYETAMNMYHLRKDHRMLEWSGEGGICEWIKGLPMMNEWLECYK